MEKKKNENRILSLLKRKVNKNELTFDIRFYQIHRPRIHKYLRKSMRLK